MSIVISSVALEGREESDYPASDGQPIAETEIHVQAIFLLDSALRDALPESAYIASDMFWYWKEGQPESRVAPDVMVIKGVGRVRRRSFFTWREGGALPCVVFETASESTWREDLGEKHPLYERLGVREYILFDPAGEHLRPRLIGFRLVEGRYVWINADADDRLWSEELGMWMKADDLMLRLIDGTTGLPVPTREERAEQEHLKAEPERLNAGQERLNAEQERLNAERARLNAEQERQRADALAAEVERLKALLEQTPGGAGGGPSE